MYLLTNSKRQQIDVNYYLPYNKVVTLPFIRILSIINKMEHMF